MDFNSIEQKILEFWKEKKIFEKSLAKNEASLLGVAKKGKKNFVFFEGPPTANGRPGIHHVEARAFKDIIPRYKTMRGFFVDRKAGWDTHGLPVELQVEKELGLKDKKEVEKYGIGEFNQKCKESVWKYKDEWEKLTERIGYWLDMKNPYVTYENYYIESLWFVLKKIWDKGLMYKGFKVVPHCPRCVTTLSSHEVAQGYKTVKENSVYVKFKAVPNKDKGINDNTYFLVWTTTPWTLPANVGLAVNPEIKYWKYKVEKGEHAGNTYILASALGSDVLSNSAALAKVTEGVDMDAKSISTVSDVHGVNLLGLKYEPLYENPEQQETDLRVVAGDFVSTEDGTGIVHIAPAYGEDDLRVGQKENLSVIHTVSSDGMVLAGLNIPGEGRFIKSADKNIIEDLKTRGLLFKEEIYEHEYPFCWRCDSPLLYYAKDSWFIKMSELRKELAENNKKINWEPAYIKNGRFGEFIKEAKDWAISRERFWGTPLPIWQCEKCGQQKAIGSLEEFKKSAVTHGNKYLLMRHGEAGNNAKNILNGDVAKNHFPLTEKGRKQVIVSAKKLKKEKIDLIFSSDFLRTKETAEIVAGEIGYDKDKIIFDNRLHEVDFGILEGKHAAEYSKYFSSPLGKLTKVLPEGESLLQIKKRMAGFAREIEGKFKDKKILIVGHDAPLYMLAVAASCLEDEEVFRQLGNDFLEKGDFTSMDFYNLPRDENYNLDLHRPYVDEIELECECGGEMKRVQEVIDVWFDSGAMPFAQWGYPHEKNSDKNFEEHYPADYICEAIDQTRGWFYTLLSVATLMEKCGVIEEGAPYKNVICLGHVLDKHGKKMSKSKGNVVDPWEMCEKFGADTLRWYLYTVNSAGDPKKFDIKDVQDKNRRVFGTLLNSLVFFKTYAENDFLPEDVESKNILDKWIISLFNSLSSAVIENIEKYDVVSAARLIEGFVDDLSNWYIRRSRERFQKPKGEEEKKEAAQTLYFVLLELSKLIAPFAPFMAEEIYQNLTSNFQLPTSNKNESVHLCDYPKPDKKLINKKLEEQMKQIRDIVAKGLALRMESKIKVRQPLSELRFKIYDLREKELGELIKDELNVKEIIFDKNIKDEVELDMEITPELKEEGLARELVRQIQSMRKEAGLSLRIK
jgi:isoleucyl-tRNA synthetase